MSTLDIRTRVQSDAVAGFVRKDPATESDSARFSVADLGTVLVTGANGFVGTNLVSALLSRDVPVIAAMRPGRKLPDAWLRKPMVRTLDWTSTQASTSLLADVDTVVHVAGSVAAKSYRGFLETNYRVTHRLLRAAADQGRPPRVILISSVAAAGPQISGSPRAASDPPQPVSLYGRSKLAGEQAAWRLSDRVPITILRPGIVFGPGDREVLKLIKLVATAHVNFLPGYSRPKFPFVAMEDLSHAILCASVNGRSLDRNRPGQGIYYIADPEPLSLAAFGRLMSKALDQKLFLNIPLPLPLVKVAATISEALSTEQSPTTFNLDKIREANTRGWACDVSQSINELGWAPSASILDRLRETIQWYRLHKWL